MRVMTRTKLELRTNEDGTREIEGYALQWEKLSAELGWWYTFREQFRKGSFKDYLADRENDVKLLISHGMHPVLGRRSRETLELKEDSTGLWFRSTLPNNTWGNDMFESISRGDTDGVSVGFRAVKEEWDESDKKNIVRTILKADLPEISLTAWPAYDSSSVATRENDPYKMYREQKEKELEEMKKYQERQRFLREISLN